MSVKELANKFADSFNNSDEATYRAILAADAKIWHSFDNKDLSVDASWEAGDQARKGMDARLELTRVEEISGGFMQEHTMHITNKKNGQQAEIYACIIATVEDGVITYLKEYIDTGAVATALA